MEGTEHKSAGARPFGALALALAFAVAVFAAGCGGGQRQDANAPSGTWKVTVEEWKFPKRQFLGTPTDFTIKVRNTDSREIPQLILTIDGLKKRVYQPGAASQIRPIWLPQDVNYANVTPYNSPLATSYNLGPLASGDVKTFSFTLSPLRRGTHEVSYSLAPDLFGKNRIVESSDGSPATETRTVAIDPTPQFDEKVFKD